MKRSSMQYTLRGVAAGALAGIPLGIAFTFFRYIDMLLIHQFRHNPDYDMSRVGVWATYIAAALPLLGLAVVMALYSAQRWQELALNHPETTGTYTRQAKSIAVGLALLVTISVLVWQFIDFYSHQVSFSSGIFPVMFNGADALLVTVFFLFTLLIIGALTGCQWGEMVGLQNYEKQLWPETAQKMSGKQHVQGGAGSVSSLLESDWGTRIVGAVSFLVPWIGVIFYLVYNNKDQEKTRAASRGIVGGISFVLPCVGILFYMAYANSDEEKAQSVAWGLGLSFVFFVLYVFLRLLGQS